MTPQRRELFRDAVGWIVLAAWAASFLAGIIAHNYRPPPELNAALLVVVVAVFGASAARR
jgi:CHASE2 domain-containing sensor protein